MSNLYKIYLSIHFKNNIESTLQICITSDYKCLPSDIERDVRQIAVVIASEIEDNRMDFVTFNDMDSRNGVPAAYIVHTNEIKYIACTYNLIKENAEGKTL